MDTYNMDFPKHKKCMLESPYYTTLFDANIIIIKVIKKLLVIIFKKNLKNWILKAETFCNISKEINTIEVSFEIYFA